jgi:uncharacterized protein (TIGR00725 family)
LQINAGTTPAFLFLSKFLAIKGNTMKKLQIGVIGSCSDLRYFNEAKQCATELGRAIARQNACLVYGAEKDIDSLPTVAAAAAQEAGGLTVGVTYEKGLGLFNNQAAGVVIATGLVRGGGRETSLMLSCDVVIALSGGSGTLNEMCVAYQAGIPVVTIDTFGGWSEELSGRFLDDRKRYSFTSASSAKQAVALAVKQAAYKQQKQSVSTVQ